MATTRKNLTLCVSKCTGAAAILLLLLSANLLGQGAATAAFSQGNEIIGSARLSVARHGHTATLLKHGQVLIIGGESASGLTCASEIYDSSLRSFAPPVMSLEARADHTATALSDGRVLIVGGRGSNGLLASTEFYEPKTRTFAEGPNLGQARSGHTATRLADGRIIVVGGDAAGSAELFDPKTGQFEGLNAHLAVPRRSHAAALLQDGRVLVAGGVGLDGEPLRSAEIFDPETLSFSARAEMQAARSGLTLRVLPDGKVQAIGGDAERTMEIFNPQGRYFTAYAHLISGPESLSAALRSSGRAVVIGRSRAPIPSSGEGTGSEALQDLLDRTGYSLTEIPDVNQAIAVGGVNSTGAPQQTAVLFSASSAIVTTDKTDYAPGETVVITGSGWQPGETVNLNVHRDNNNPPDTLLTAVADADGNFQNSELVVQQSDLWVTFLLTATGQSSGYTAETTFTDANNVKVKAAAPAGTTFTLKATNYTSTDCSGTGTAQPDQTVGSSDVNVNFPQQTQSVKLEAAAYSDQCGAFVSWTSSGAFTNLPPRSICVTGTGDEYVANYVPSSIDDGNACTTDSCDTSTGFISHTTAPSGTVCRASAGVCDVAETCDGTSTTCPPEDAKQPAGTACPDDGNACTLDQCDGTSDTCQHPVGNAGAICRAAAGVCDAAETCTGSSSVCPADVKQPAGTACPDDGNACTLDQCNGTSNSCQHPAGNAGAACTPDSNACTLDQCNGTSTSCQHTTPAPAGTVCRAAVGVCDAAETCTGTTTVCPTDVKQPAGTACPDDGNACTLDQCNGTSNSCQHPAGNPGAVCADDGLACTLDQCGSGSNLGECRHTTAPAGTVCRAAADECDAVETCTGSSATCPADTKKSAGTACTDDGNACTRDICDGTSVACTHPAGNAGAVCRAATDACDVAESCTGSSATCPNDAVKSAGTTCRAAAGACDAVEACDGTAKACPNDAKLGAGTQCRASAGQCDVAESCNGSSNDCPADGFATAATVCTGTSNGGACDATDHCSGSGNTCVDQYQAAGFECRGSAGQCDVAETCSGTSGACPADGFATAATVCTGTSNGGACDATDHCSGTGNTCVDQYQAAGFECRASAGQCDVAETCSGTSGACPADGFATAATVCTGTSNGGACDATDHCSGTGNTCVDQYQAATTVCRASAGQCDVAENCTGSTGACPADAYASAATSCTGASNGGACDDDAADRCSGTANTCNDAFKAANTACTDDGNVCTRDICNGTSAACTHPAGNAGTNCRAAAGVCDVAETCDGINTACPADAKSTAVCRPATDACDVAESCNGVSNDCPANGFASAGTACGDSSSGQCDLADTCNGAGACQTNHVADGTSCGDAGTQCTNQDTCSSGACHDNGFKAAGTACGDSSSGQCDLADTCNGAGACQTNHVADGTSCGDAGTQCTNQDTCSSGACHDNGFKAEFTACGDPDSTACNAADSCNATGTCVDRKKAANTVCLAGTGTCDPDDVCDGTSNTCAPVYAAVNTTCSDGNACTQTDQCNGSGQCVGSNPVVCTASDQCHDAGTCNTGTGVCSNPNKADGSACNDGNACTQTDTCQAGACSGSSPVVCTASDQCHVAGTCDTATGACSNPAKANGSACNDGNACTQTDTCQAGACTGGSPVNADDGNACTVDSCDPITGVHHVVIPDCGGTACGDGTNTPPAVGTVTASPSGPVAVGGSVQITATFTDASLNQTHTCSIAWDDTTTDTFAATTESSGGSIGTCVKSHTYGSTGVYTVTVTVTDQCGAASNPGVYQFVVIYDPSGGFVTGGGWIDSKAGSYTADFTLSGKATFGFVSKYKKGATIPDGETEFQFQVANFNFHSSVYEWLVVSGAKAQYKGSGTVNNAGNYGFLLTATDGDALPNNAPDRTDKFRIKIWDKTTNVVVYDNKYGSPDDLDIADPQTIGGGSIVVHKIK